MFRLGLIINPVAGIGGSVALKGSDGMVQRAQQLGARPQAQVRARHALELLQNNRDQFRVYTAAHDMGEYVCRGLGFDVSVVSHNSAGETTASDTEKAVQCLLHQGIDLLVFAGGDGTARNVFNAMMQCDEKLRVPVLGIPAGCKIHSAVYAVTPQHAGELLSQIIRGRALSMQEASVMDIDEEAFRHDVVKARRYGYLTVPVENQYMQGMKEGAVTHEDMILHDIAVYITETMEDDVMYFIGSGSTPKAVMDALQLESTLLGIDAVSNRQLVAKDINEKDMLQLISTHPVKIVLTVIGGQGHLFGRGNQQFSPAVIRAVGKENLLIIATPEKIHGLDGKPIRVDTGDVDLDHALYGMAKIITGYDEHTLYRIG
ncbi:MAG: ATP-NAD kinase family protein [Gammaproteobacteria bacterium]|nr:ATP-NAD kinase family protein [Gammaproteobacteria bacterium]